MAGHTQTCIKWFFVFNSIDLGFGSWGFLLSNSPDVEGTRFYFLLSPTLALLVISCSGLACFAAAAGQLEKWQRWQASIQRWLPKRTG